MAEKWPKAYDTLTKISFDNLQIATMAKLVDADKLTLTLKLDSFILNATLALGILF